LIGLRRIANGRHMRLLPMIFACAALVVSVSGESAAKDLVEAGILTAPRLRETLSILDRPAEDDGIAGAKLGVQDDNTTGRFLGQEFRLEAVRLEPGSDPRPALERLAKGGAFYVLANLPADDLVSLADAARDKNILVFNIGAPDQSLREENCRANLIHVVPSHDMLADGLAQYLAWKQWKRWLLIKGSHPRDELYAMALRRAAKKFGAAIVEERVYEDRGGGRRSDSGSVQTQRLIPVLTQNAPAYDVLVAADESEVFANYLPYRTYDPRPVVGSAGLKPLSWDASHEQWGAIQLQNRFVKLAGRVMSERDHAAWVAMRMIGEAATRAGTTEPDAIRAYLFGPDFSIAAFKGQKLTLRPWNLQLRQPVLLGDGRMIVSVSPQEGFLHQVSELDTLGLDRPETRCRLK
jgi:ABC transporter substrate binding protein (PQQ-dependent alcohol dehydrogenase system)